MSKTSVKAKLDMIQSFSRFMDSGSQSATIVFYEGTQPTSTEISADASKKLVTLTFPEPCVKEVTTTHVELFPTDLGTVIKSGTATWARIYNGSSEVATDLTVGEDVTLANTSLALGGTLSITSMKLRP